MDESILRAFNALAADPTVAAVAVALSSRWILLVVGLPAALPLLAKRRFAAVLSVALATAAADQLSSHVVKPLVARERPCRALTGLITPDGCGPARSFPSSHASTGTALAVAAAPFYRRGWAILLPIAALVSMSRVVLGVHYPTDIVAGAILGALAGGITILIRSKLPRAFAASPAKGPADQVATPRDLLVPRDESERDA